MTNAILFEIVEEAQDFFLLNRRLDSPWIQSFSGLLVRANIEIDSELIREIQDACRKLFALNRNMEKEYSSNEVFQHNETVVSTMTIMADTNAAVILPRAYGANLKEDSAEFRILNILATADSLEPNTISELTNLPLEAIDPILNSMLAKGFVTHRRYPNRWTVTESGRLTSSR